MRVAFSLTVVEEVLFSLLLLPLCRFRLASRYPTPVVHGDASPGGQGLAYSHLDPGTLHRLCRLADTRGRYATLGESEPFKPDPPHQLRKLSYPWRKHFWHEVSRPGGYDHISLEEMDAHLWGDGI